MDITEGNVVGVVGKLDNKIREKDAVGTVWFIHSGEVAVILTGGDIWRGAKHAVYPYPENP